MKDIIAKISPGTQEREKFTQTTKEFIDCLQKHLTDAAAVLGGSGAKNTWLAGNHDMDIYVIFDYQKYSQKSSELSKILEPCLKKSFPKKRISSLHGSRDYFQMEFNGFLVEVIPILKIGKAEDAINITDISPLHAKWVKKNAKKMKDDIRLAKQFCKGQKIYGAESFISGFSGYVLEILVVYYGGFEKLLRASSKWRNKQVIDAEKYYKGQDALFHLNKSKQQSPIIVVDPVDKSRNAAAALSKEKFQLFRKKAKSYLNNPNSQYFEEKTLDLAELKNNASKRGYHFVTLEVIPLVGKEDVVGSKLLKAFNFLEKELDSFTVKKSGWEWNKKAIFYFVLEKKDLPSTKISLGPPIKMKDAVKSYKKKHKKSYVKNGRIVAEVKVKFPKLRNHVQNLLNNNYVEERVKKISFS